MERLRELLSTLPATASTHVIFRIKANIGHSYTRLGDEAEGARWLIEAWEEEPQSPKAIANRILAHLLLDQFAEAVALGRDTLLADPGNELAAFYLIQAAGRVPAEPDALAGVPPAIRNRPDIVFAQIISERAKNSELWITLAQKARSRFPTNRRIGAAAAEADIAQIASNEQYRDTYKLPPQTQSTLQDAARLLTSGWHEALASEVKLTGEHFAPAAAAMVAFKLVRQQKEAAEIASQLVSKGVQDRQTLFNAVQILQDEGGQDELINVALERAPGAPELEFFRALRLLNKGNWDAASAILKSIAVPDFEKDLVATTLAIAPYRDGSKPVSEAELRSIMPATSADPRALIVFARIAHQRGFLELAEEAFGYARKGIVPSSNMAQRLMVANYAADSNDATAVIQLLDSQVPLDVPSMELQWLATAHSIQSPKRESNATFFKTLAPDVAGLPAYAKRHASVLLDMGLPGEAMPKLQRLRDQLPRDAFIILRLAEAHMRLGNEAALEALVKSVDAAQIEGRPEHLMGVAQLICQHGRTDDALKLGYTVLCANDNNPRVVLGYTGLFLVEPDRRVVDIPEVVVPGTAVSLKDEANSITTIVIDEDGTGFWGTEVRSPTADDIRPLLGQKRGFRQSSPRRFQSNEFQEIAEIKSKYLHAFHQILDQFEYRFPDHGGLWQIRSVGDDITPFLNAVRQLEESDRAVADRYVGQKLPLAMVARMMGRDALSFASYVRQRGHDIITCDGKLPEREAAISLAVQHRDKGATIDLYTAAVAAQTGALPILKEWFGQLYAPSSTIALFDRLLEKEQGKLGKESMSIASINGQLVRAMPSDDEVRERIASVERAKKQVLDNATIEKALLPDDAPEAVANVAEKLGSSVFEGVFLAKKHRNVLLSDDHPFRIVASEIVELGSTWLQPVLMAARDAKMIDDATYSKQIAGLAKHRHNTSINSDDLVRALKGEGNLDYSDYVALAGCLGGKNAEMNSHTGVAVGFLLALWGDENPDVAHLRENATGRLLECILRHRQQDWAVILGYIAAATENKQGVLEYISQWVHGHFLPVSPVNESYGRFRQMFQRRLELASLPRSLRSASSHLAIALSLGRGN